MRDVRFRLLCAMVLFSTAALATTAWSRPHAASPHRSGPGSSWSLPGQPRTPYALGWIAAFWNDGSCHGYPDVTEIYVLYGDSATNTWDSWEDIGQTDGWDSCDVWHDPTWYPSPGWSACDTYSPNHAGCVNFDEYVQGNYSGLDASTTWTPDDGICDGSGCWHMLSGAEMIRAANRQFTNAQMTRIAHTGIDS